MAWQQFVHAVVTKKIIIRMGGYIQAIFLNVKDWTIYSWEQWIEVSLYKVLGLYICSDDFIVYLGCVPYCCHVKSQQVHTFCVMRLLFWAWQ